MLYIVATPIGNLEDMTLRGITTLQEVDFILSEDTRVTKKLLNHFDIDTPTISFHEHSDENKYQKVFELLEEGKNLALVTDAGTPAISDPGAFLVKEVREKMPDIKISPIPGASAITAALSVAGLSKKEFIFLGFPPHKKGRKTFFENVAKNSESEIPTVFYESKHRIIKALEALNENCPDKNILVLREMTKMFEEIISGKPSEILEKIQATPEKTKGEFVVIVD
jgi:16S rRNA (cytidine1402-2'-O)-methyltransferase